ncbi:shikimate 5-dehydrogenase [Sagittula marina]|uniref:Shikimate 5-dehydrogenase n=1 Tax=Sagittula marina TaxID=943940 RepID=A0A7W6GTA0_9RHOB|nr:hypothetical protein [Sagittula marina]MBB3984979.1 shikimate 5-dehydrogenase [Sagittula marina]
MNLEQSPETGVDRGQTVLKLGLVGRGIQLSRTPAMHEAEAKAHGLTCRYDLLDTDADTKDDLAAILAQADADRMRQTFQSLAPTEGELV